MSAFDELRIASFAGIGFAVTRWGVKGGIREHTHEYPKSPGGQIEKLGRKLYEVEFDAVFSTNDPAHRGAFPDDLNTLRVLFEKQETGPLVIPHLGEIPAVCIDWDEQAEPARMRDGIRMKLRFREDSEEELSLEELVSTSYSSLDSAIDLMVGELAAYEESEPDLFESLEGAANEVVGAMDQAEAMGDMASAKLEGAISKVNQIDEKFSALSDPANWKLMRAVHDFGAALIQTNEDILRSSRPTKTYVTPVEMSVAQVSTAVFGDTSHAAEILLMNAITDAFAIPAGTTLKVYADDLPAAA